MKALYLPSNELALQLINASNPEAKLTTDKVILDTPVPNTDAGDTLNSKMLVRARKGKGFRDSQAVTFDRLDVAALFRGTNVFLDVKEPKTTLELLSALQSGYGVNLRPEDIVSAPVPPGANPPLENPDDPDPTPVEHEIVVAPNSYGYIGKFTVLIGVKPATGERLSRVITNTKLDGLFYPDGSSGVKGQAYIYSYGVDCTPLVPYFNTLHGVVVGAPIEPVRLAAEMNKVFFEEWKDSELAADFNTRGAKMVYEGSTQLPGDAGWYEGVNRAYSHVVVIELSDVCSNFQGHLYLHYNA